MRKLWMSLALVLPLAGAALAVDDKKDEAKGKAVEYVQHSGHFQKNNTDLKGDESRLVLTSREAFDKIFGVGAVMGGKQKFVPKDAFDTKLVVAVIKRGNAITTYKVEKVTDDDGTLYLQYDATPGPVGTAQYSSPLIVSVPKGKYKEVVFLENGKKVGTEKVETPKEK